jgi:hypothetical protein
MTEGTEMEQVVEEVRGPVPRVSDVSLPFSTISWRAVFAGVVVALATQILLTTLGLAIGTTTLEASTSTRTLRAAGIGVGIWYLVSTLLSVFFGGLIAGISARELTRTLGSIEGLLVWALSLLLTIWFVTSGVQSVIAQASGMIAIDPSQFGGGRGSMPRDMQMDPGTAQDVAGASTIASWIAFGTLLLSAACGVLGGVIGARFNRRELDRVEVRPSVSRVPTTLRPTEA